jgi:hypothetical protein
MEDKRYSSTILDLDPRERLVASFTSRPVLPRGKSPQYPSVSLRAGLDTVEKRKNLLLPEIDPRPSSL